MVSVSDSKVLITGSDGFIGSFLFNRLQELGAEVKGVDLKSGFDITDWSHIEQLEKVDVVYHLAAIMGIPFAIENPRIVYNVNIGGTLNILEYCRLNDISKLIFATSYVYGEPEYLPVDENHPINPTNPYTRSKIIGEELCRGYCEDHDISCVILRPFNIYGPGQNEEFLIPTIFHQLRTENKIVLKDPEPRRDLIYVTDMIDAYLRSLEFQDSKFEIFNIGCGESHSVSEIVNEVLQVSGKEVEVEYVNDRRPNEIMDTVANIDKAKHKLNWSPKIDLRTGLKLIWDSIDH